MKMCVVHLVLTCWYPAAGLQKWRWGARVRRRPGAPRHLKVGN